MKYHLAYPTGRVIERSTTSFYEEAETMARVMSRGCEDYASQTIMVCDEDNAIRAFYHDGVKYASIT